MSFINAQQLAFVLEITKEDARAKMCVAWEKFKGLNHTTERVKGKIVTDYPEVMDAEMIANQLNLPQLPLALKDIHDNYLKRPGSKKWILCDFPEKELQTKPRNKIRIPSVLKSLLSDDDVQYIQTQWNKRYGIQF